MTSRNSICLMGRCSFPMNQPWVMGMKPQPPTAEKRAALMGRQASCWKRLDSVTQTVVRPAAKCLVYVRVGQGHRAFESVRALRSCHIMPSHISQTYIKHIACFCCESLQEMLLCLVRWRASNHMSQAEACQLSAGDFTGRVFIQGGQIPQQSC